MRKILLALSVSTLFCTSGINRLNAQLEDGSIAPDWTLTDINGITWNLYDLLDQNISVFLDYSAVWCGPCWSYHTSGALESLYEDYGPEASGEVMVFMIEGDGTSTLDELNGIGAGTVGDWVEGTPYPIILTHFGDDSYDAVQDYDIAYFPTIYRICPNRIVDEVGQISVTALYNSMGDCSYATANNDPAIMAYKGVESACSEVDLVVDMQNMGFDNLTACTFTVYENGTEVLTHEWSGNLPLFGIEEVNLGGYTPSTSENEIEITITSADEDASNNSVSADINYEDYVPQIIHLEFKTDNYPTQLRWEIRDENDDVVYNDGPYSTGEKNEVVFDEDLVFPAQGCYKFICYDTGGEGIQSPGYFEIREQDGTFIADNDNNFGSRQTIALKVEDQVAIDNISSISNISLYPNPANELITLSFHQPALSGMQITIFDMFGRSVVVVLDESNNSGASSYTVATKDLANGIYFVEINNGDVSETLKFTVAH